jgi:hypothetical protein
LLKEEIISSCTNLPIFAQENKAALKVLVEEDRQQCIDEIEKELSQFADDFPNSKLNADLSDLMQQIDFHYTIHNQNGHQNCNKGREAFANITKNMADIQREIHHLTEEEREHIRTTMLKLFNNL